MRKILIVTAGFVVQTCNNFLIANNHYRTSMQGVAVFGCQCIAVCPPDEECEYCPDRALSAALKDWMEELNQPLQAGKIYLSIYV